MWLFVGLGNPGDKYKNNRHNVGFMVIDQIAGASVFKSKFQADMSEIRIGGEKLALLKPLTYMNESGQSVQKCAKFYKIPPERIIVFHDELDLKPGEVRVKKGGGNAGHNGLKSIQAHLGSPDFWRIRIGIGHPGDRNQVSNYVLSDFAKADQEWLEELIDVLADHSEMLITETPESYVKAVNHARKPE